MTAINFSKLVRDRIPEILRAKGIVVETRTVEGAEYLRALHAKLIEEASELDRALTTDDLKNELADVFEVLDAIADAYGFRPAELRAVQEKKRLERGGFRKKIFLVKTKDAH